MSLRESAQQALEALELAYGYSMKREEAIEALKAALAEPERKPLNEDQMYEACINVWRNLPDGFGHTSSEWIEAGIRYAERAHGIGEQK